MSRVVDRNRMRRFKALRSETVGAEACLASCPTACCRSGTQTGTTNDPLVFGSTSALLSPAGSRLRLDFSHQQQHTSSSSLPARSLARYPQSNVV